MLISSELQRLRAAISNIDMIDEQISSQGIGWHIEHSILVINKVCVQLRISYPTNYHWNFSPMFKIHALLGYIPRGRTTAPKRLIPTKNSSAYELIDALDLAIENLRRVEHLSHNHYCIHPIYGMLNLKHALFFIRLHTRHHLKIIDEIEHAYIYSHGLMESY